MKKKNLTIYLFGILGLLCSLESNAQIPGKLEIRALTTSAIPTVKEEKKSRQFIFGESALQELFDKYHLLEFKQLYPVAIQFDHPNAEPLSKVYELTCDCDETLLMEDLVRNASKFYTWVEPMYEVFPTCRSLPNDPFSNEPDNIPGPNNDDYWSSWFLSMMEVYDMYCLFEEDSNTPIGIVDVNFKPDHEDLAANVITTSNTATTPTNLPTNWHGTGTASHASPVTNNDKGVAGVGNNSPLMLYSGLDYNNIALAATEGAKVINCSWISGSLSNSNQALLDMVMDQGVVIVASAGNGNYGPSTGGDHGFSFPASYDRVISVSSINMYKKFADVNSESWCLQPNTTLPTIWSTHNTAVDVVAPGHCTYGATVYDNGGIGSIFDAYDWGYAGTSISAPLVAGICAVMLDANPSLTPTEVADILKSSGEDVSGVSTNASYYPNSPVPKLVNAYRAVLAAKNMAELTDVESYITGNEIWDSPKYAKEDIFITNGASLTVESELLMCPDLKIVVLPGGHLIINGGRVYSSCGQWAGIMVLGNSAQSQNPVSGTEQGKVTIENHATIENAMEAVSVYLPGDDSTNGGIVEASNSAFINNNRSIYFRKYQNFDPLNNNAPSPNLSYVDKCIFTIDDGFEGKFAEHIRLYQVDGIKLRGNTFENISNSQFRGIGINSIDANFSAEGYCNTNDIPCSSWQHSQFYGHKYGINVSMISCLYTYKVDRANFEYNAIGINSTSVITPKIIRSNFEISPVPYNQGESEIGIRINGGTGYIVEENNFTGIAPSLHQPIGVLVRNTGGGNNQIYKNNFNNLHCANLSNGNNRNAFNPFLGLHYYCNDNQNNVYDFAIPAEDGANNIGIAGSQGSQGNPAGNTFSYNTISEDDIFNYSGNPILYHYYLFEPNEFPADNSSSVSLASSQDANRCLPNKHLKVKGGVSTMSSQYWSNRNSKEFLEHTLVSLRGDDDKEGLQSEIAFYDNKMSRNASSLVHYYMTENLAQHSDSLVIWLENKQSLAADYALVDYWLHKRNIAKANQQLNSIPEKYELTAEQKTAYTYFSQLKKIAIRLVEQGKTMEEITAEELEQVKAIAEQSEGQAGMQAQSLMNEFFNADYFDLPILPKGYSTVRLEKENSIQKERSLSLINAFPNPTSSRVNFQYEFEEDDSNKSIQIMDSFGRLVKEIPLSTLQGTIEWNAGEVQSGIYFYRLTSDDRVVASGKLVVIQ